MYSTDHDSKQASEMENTIELQHMEKPSPINRHSEAGSDNRTTLLTQ
jgi:hypothetical protein